MDSGNVSLLVDKDSEKAVRRRRPFPKLARTASRRWNAAISETNLAAADRSSGEPFDVLSSPPPYESLLQLGYFDPEEGLMAYVAPYLRRAAAELANSAKDAEASGVEGAVTATLTVFYSLRHRLVDMSQRAAALLFNVARLKGELVGETAEERMACFRKRLLEIDYRRSCRDYYPILDESLRIVTSDALISFREFLGRLAADQALIATIVPGGLGRIERLQYYAGDPHNQGRCVVVIHGERGCIVYKPRPLDTDVVMSRTLGWLDSHLRIGLHHPLTIQCAGYGWTEFVAPRDCDTIEDVRLCYERFGAIIAMIFLLGGSDIHHGNIICCGATPYIIDVEALLNGPLAATDAPERRRQRARIENIYNTCYLPGGFIIGDTVVDLSGAGYRPGQEIDIGTRVDHGGGDEVVAKPVRASSLPSANVPSFQGKRQEPLQHTDSVERGMRRAMLTMLAHRDEFLTAEDLMPSFRTATSRFVPRATSQYARTLQDSLHPHACRDRQAQDRALSTLSWQGCWRKTAAVRMLSQEITELRRGDVPFFKSVAGSRSLFTTTGREIPDVFQESGYEAAVRRIKRLNHRQIDNQINVLHLAFSASEHQANRELARRSAIGQSEIIQVPNFEPVATHVAHRCRQHLIENASSIGHALTWTPQSFDVPLTGLAHGSCGIGLALAEFGAAFRDESAWEAAYQALAYANASFDEKIGLWRDHRHEEGHANAWCHGAAGMTMARQRVVELDPKRATADRQILIDIARGLASQLQPYGPVSDTLCHGRSGNWEALWRGEANHRKAAEEQVNLLCGDWNRGVLPAGDLSEPTPDLMNGLSGIGLQILRSFDRTVPCVALLGA